LTALIYSLPHENQLITIRDARKAAQAIHGQLAGSLRGASAKLPDWSVVGTLSLTFHRYFCMRGRRRSRASL
jgi:hypothetical protein